MRVPGFAICLALTALGAYAAWSRAPRANQLVQQSSSAPAQKLQNLQELGGIYGTQAKVSITKVEMIIAGKVTDDSAAWAKRLEEALAVGYAPAAGVFASIPFTDVKPFIKVRMVAGRTPEETVIQVVRSGNVIAQVTWYFAGIDPIKSYAVFSPQGEPLFDTLLSLPLIRGRVLGMGH